MISLIVVNYRAAALAAGCIESARRAAADPLQVIVVDNSLDPAEADRLRPHADALVAPAANDGYAAAINIGRTLATGDVLLVSNPDVVFGTGSIDLLASALHGRTSVAGPALFWDDDYRWLLPPAERTTGFERLDAAIASRSRSWAERRDRRRIRNRLRFWQTLDTTLVPAVSGAVMAIRTREFDLAGGFDERFRLYFEEIDFMRRIERAGGTIAYVPSARCRHLYNQSAGTSAAAADALYAQSERAYLEKWIPRPIARLAAALERPRQENGFLPLQPGQPIEIDLDDALVEASPLPAFDTAAGHFPPRGRLEIPPEVVGTYRGQSLYLRVIDCASGEIRGRYVWRSAGAD